MRTIRPVRIINTHGSKIETVLSFLTSTIMVHLIVHELTDIITSKATCYELMYPLVSDGYWSVLRDASLATILEHIKKHGWSETWYIRKDSTASENQSSNMCYYQTLHDYDGTLTLEKQRLVRKSGLLLTEDCIGIIEKLW